MVPTVQTVATIISAMRVPGKANNFVVASKSIERMLEVARQGGAAKGVTINDAVDLSLLEEAQETLKTTLKQMS